MSLVNEQQTDAEIAPSEEPQVAVTAGAPVNASASATGADPFLPWQAACQPERTKIKEEDQVLLSDVLNGHVPAEYHLIEGAIDDTRDGGTYPLVGFRPKGGTVVVKATGFSILELKPRNSWYVDRSVEELVTADVRKRTIITAVTLCRDGGDSSIARVSMFAQLDKALSEKGFGCDNMRLTKSSHDYTLTANYLKAGLSYSVVLNLGVAPVSLIPKLDPQYGQLVRTTHRYGHDELTSQYTGSYYLFKDDATIHAMDVNSHEHKKDSHAVACMSIERASQGLEKLAGLLKLPLGWINEYLVMVLKSLNDPVVTSFELSNYGQSRLSINLMETGVEKPKSIHINL
jgi:hypothetical protein